MLLILNSDGNSVAVNSFEHSGEGDHCGWLIQCIGEDNDPSVVLILMDCAARNIGQIPHVCGMKSSVQLDIKMNVTNSWLAKCRFI